MREIRIGNKTVGMHHRPYFIADIAANHDGDLGRALSLIEMAAEAGADAAKFQNFKAEKIVSDWGFRNLGKSLSHQKAWKKPVFETYQDASLPDEWSARLMRQCQAVGIEYMTSPYDFTSVDWAFPFVNCYKIGSGEISWPDMLRYIAKKKKPVLLATGAASIDEVQSAVETILSENEELVLMQCNTNYTAQHDNFKYINLRVLETYARLYPDCVLGLSDHTIGYTTVLGAIALGARVIEKHFTDDTSRTGPDHPFSTTPVQWREMVRAANDLFDALGDGKKRIEGNELDSSIVQRRGIYLAKSKLKGDAICKDDFVMLRPRSLLGFEPYEEDALLGCRLLRDISSGEMLYRKDIDDANR